MQIKVLFYSQNGIIKLLAQNIFSCVYIVKQQANKDSELTNYR